jgi:hypothetical protein
VGEPAATRITPAPSELEAAAIVAALERFRAETAPPPEPVRVTQSGWLRAARLEAVARDPHTGANL